MRNAPDPPNTTVLRHTPKVRRCLLVGVWVKNLGPLGFRVKIILFIGFPTFIGPARLLPIADW